MENIVEDLYGEDGFVVEVEQSEDGKWWATWLQAGVGAAADTRTDALRALADLLDEAGTWAHETTTSPTT